VHGLASPLGAMFPIPHGMVCGTLVAAATAVNIRVLRAREPENVALNKYAQVGRLLVGKPLLSREEAWEQLVSILGDWTQWMQLPQLHAYGIQQSDLPTVVANCRGSSMKTNPIVLTDAEIHQVLLARL